MEPRPIASSALVVMAAKAVSLGCHFLVGVVLARTLAVADFGTFSQVWLVNKSLQFLALGLPVSVYYFVPKLPRVKHKGLVGQTVASLTVLAIPFAVLLYFLADVLAVRFHNPALSSYLRLFAVYPLVTLPAIGTDAVLIAMGRAKWAAAYEVVTRVTMLVVVAAVALITRDVAWVLKALLAHGMGQLLLGLLLMWLPVRGLPWQLSLRDLREQVVYSAPYGFAMLMAALNYQVDKVLVSLLYPPAIFAFYAAGAFEIPVAGVTSAPVVSVIMPELTTRFSSGDTGRFLTLWHHSMVKVAVPVLGVAAFLMVVAGPVVVALFSSAYAPAVPLFRLYLLFLVLRITVLDQVLASLGETRFVARAQVLSIAVNIVLGYALIRGAGWIGAAVSALAAGYFGAALLLIRIGKILKVPMGRLVPWRDLSKVAGIAVLAAAGAATVAALGSGAFWKVGTALILFAGIYVLGNLRTQAITPHDLRSLRNWILTVTRRPAAGES